MYYDTNYSGPAFPVVEIRITFRHKGQRIGLLPFTAYVDTGADLTCIPPSVVPTESRSYKTGVKVRYADGRERVKPGLLLPDAIVELKDNTGKWVSSGRSHMLLKLIIQDALLGRDVLNQHVSMLDGPQLVLDIS
jgi:hypothetical protein